MQQGGLLFKFWPRVFLHGCSPCACAGSVPPSIATSNWIVSDWEIYFSFVSAQKILLIVNPVFVILLVLMTGLITISFSCLNRPVFSLPLILIRCSCFYLTSSLTSHHGQITLSSQWGEGVHHFLSVSYFLFCLSATKSSCSGLISFTMPVSSLQAELFTSQ